MKALIVLIALSLPSMSSAAEFLDVECYIAEGTTVTKTFDGTVFGTVKNNGNRMTIEGQNVVRSSHHRTNTPDTCAAPTQTHYDNEGYSYQVKQNNLTIYEFDFSQVELSCALGSVVKKFGDLANFRKAREAAARRNASTGYKPQCLDFSGLE